MKTRLPIIPALAIGVVLPLSAGRKNDGADRREIASDRQKYEIIVDSDGVMRRSDNGLEVSYYGTNYTAPFAYSYRALGYEGKDRKTAIDRDIYHIARLGLNAYRLHLWDAELADSLGNLVENEHLDLLDYMIAQLEKRGIDIVLTAQTNFGNGYPEKDNDTGSFTYDFAKCDIHDNPAAQAAQERYLQQLVKHVNPYTGRSISNDRSIIAIEINNEPCHSGTKPEVTAYIDRMSKALRKGGYKRLILYNVTHNPQVTSAYYDAADIQGTTYQWYPTGLVAGHERKGNFLPALDNYTIPWEDSIPAYRHLARAVYEFDPADVLYSHLYPAIARTFRKKGFQWITQFAYDPIDLAQYNTEYVTHYMNLAYTPAKALSMMVAAETAREIPRGADYGRYPDNTTFGHTTVSHDPDFSVFSSPDKFIYTNSNDVRPVDINVLRQVAGLGTSAVVRYDGSGAYFLDATSEPGVWRLEVMPDVVQLDDPFVNVSLNDAKMVTVSREHPMTIGLPQLGKDFTLYNVSASVPGRIAFAAAAPQPLAAAKNGTVEVTPGVYLLVAGGVVPDFAKLVDEKVAGNIGITEYAAPEPARTPIGLLSARKSDIDMDVNMIPEAWDFSFSYCNPNWYDPEHYILNINGNAGEGRTVVRRRVGDKVARVPENIRPAELKVQFLTVDPSDGYSPADLPPEGTEIAVVTRDGYTYAAPLHFTPVAATPNIPASSAIATVRLDDLKPVKGVIMPAPYPVTVTRDIPATTLPAGDFRNIEFIQLMIPNKPSHMLLKEIWLE